MLSYIFLINRTIFVRETSFQQVLLSSSGPKENISINTICSNTQLLNKEEKHLKNALKNCQYPTCAINKIQQKTNNPARKQTNNRNSNITQRSCMVGPYYGGLSESIKTLAKNLGCRCIVKEALPSRTS